jgi:hypothetical protein
MGVRLTMIYMMVMGNHLLMHGGLVDNLWRLRSNRHHSFDLSFALPDNQRSRVGFAIVLAHELGRRSVALLADANNVNLVPVTFAHRRPAPLRGAVSALRNLDFLILSLTLPNRASRPIWRRVATMDNVNLFIVAAPSSAAASPSPRRASGPLCRPSVSAMGNGNLIKVSPLG